MTVSVRQCKACGTTADATWTGFCGACGGPVAFFCAVHAEWHPDPECPSCRPVPGPAATAPGPAVRALLGRVAALTALAAVLLLALALTVTQPVRERLWNLVGPLWPLVTQTPKLPELSPLLPGSREQRTVRRYRLDVDAVLREAPSESADGLTLWAPEFVEMIESTDSGWAHVRYRETDGWLRDELLHSVDAPYVCGLAGTDGDPLVRQATSDSAPGAGTVRRGESYLCTKGAGSNANWVWVEGRDGRGGWLRAEKVTEVRVIASRPKPESGFLPPRGSVVPPVQPTGESPPVLPSQEEARLPEPTAEPALVSQRGPESTPPESKPGAMLPASQPGAIPPTPQPTAGTAPERPPAAVSLPPSDRPVPPGVILARSDDYEFVIESNLGRFPAAKRHELAVPPGTYELTLRADDVYLSKTTTVTVPSGGDVLVPVPKLLTVSLVAFPGNCQASVDGEPAQPTPWRPRLVAGVHEFRFVWPALGRAKSLTLNVIASTSVVCDTAQCRQEPAVPHKQ